MKNSKKLLNSTLFLFFNDELSNYTEEPQNSEYESFTFRVGVLSFRNRLAKKLLLKKVILLSFGRKINKKRITLSHLRKALIF